MAQTGQNEDTQTILIRYSNTDEFDESRMNALLGTMQPEYYGYAEYMLSDESLTAWENSTTEQLNLPFSDNKYNADYGYSDTFESVNVTIISEARVTDTVSDEYTITTVTAYDSYGNEIEVTINGQTVIVVDENYVSGDTITVYIYISLNPEVVTTFDDYLDTNVGNATISNSEYGVSIEVESPQLLPDTSSYTVKYMNIVTNEEISDSKEANYIAINTIIKPENEEIEIEGYEYVEASGEYITVSETADDNVLILYYVETTTTVDIIKKAQDTDETLEGVEFSLFELICEDSSDKHDEEEIDVDDYDETCWELVSTYETDENGLFTLEDLPITGEYRLVETETVGDYVLPNGQWKIEFDYGNLTDDEALIDYNGQGIKITAIGNPPAVSLNENSSGEDILIVYNYISFDIPTTGLEGISNYYKTGIGILLVGLFILLCRKFRLVYVNKNNSKPRDGLCKMNIVNINKIKNTMRLTSKDKSSRRRNRRHFK